MFVRGQRSHLFVSNPFRSGVRVSSIYRRSFCVASNNAKNNDFKALQSKLEKDKRYRITKNEYFQLAEETGIDKPTATKYLQDLKSNELITEIATVDKYLFIHPDRVVNHLTEVLDPNNTHTEAKIKIDRETLSRYLAEKKKLDDIRDDIEQKAARSTTRVLWTLAGTAVLQGVAIARLTWWDLSWDIMEPVTYLLTFGTSVVFLAYFQAYRMDFSYEVMRRRLHNKRRIKFFRKRGFDIDQYNKLCISILDTQNQLVLLGVPTSEIEQYPLNYQPLFPDLPQPCPPGSTPPSQDPLFNEK